MAETSIDDLNYECLREIFLRLDFMDRIKLREVSRAWRDDLDDTWSALREVNIVDAPTLNDQGLSGALDVITIRAHGPGIVESVLQRCGNRITSLNDRREMALTMRQDNFLLPLAIQYCPNVKKLRTFVSTELDDENLNVYLADKQLKFLKIMFGFEDANLCFSQISPDSLESVDFDIWWDSYDPTDVFLQCRQNFINRCSGLKTLAVDFVNDELLEVIGQKNTLEQLQLQYGSRQGMMHLPVSFSPILGLTNLRALYLRMRRVVDRSVYEDATDELLLGLPDNLPLLEIVEIEGPGVTQRGLSKLATLPNLGKLRMPDCPDMCHQLRNFSHLEVLDLMDCEALQDEQAIAVLEMAGTMRELNLSRCSITNATLEAAVRITAARENAITLNLNISETEARPRNLIKRSPRLKMIRQNPYHFRFGVSYPPN